MVARFAIELCVSQTVTIVFSDSQSAIYLTKNNANHSNAKHISVQVPLSNILLLQERLKKIHTFENLINILTKPLPINKFEHCLDLTGVHNI